MNDPTLADILKDHSGEVLILILICLILGTLLIVVPQLLRANLHKNELLHAQRLKSLELGVPLPRDEDSVRLAGRTAMLVPMVVVISAATVTSFLVVYKSEHVFPVALSIWVVAGVVSLAAVTGGVALMGKLAHLDDGDEDTEEDEESQEESYMR